MTSKDSENLKKPLHIMGKYKNLHCRFVTLGASGGTALKINKLTKDMTTGSLEHFGKPPSVNTV